MDLSQVIELSKQTALNLSGVAKQMGIITTKIKEQDIEIREIKNDFESFKEEQKSEWMKQKEKEYIEPDEQQELDQCITNRIVDLFKENGFSDDDFKKYFGWFKKKAWADGKRYSHVVGKSGVYTRKMYFNEVKEYYGTWTPHGYGVIGYRDHLNVA